MRRFSYSTKLSHVDTENEALIQEALERLMVGRTTLIIAHRLSSVIDADRIVVLEDGAIVESGTHRDLVSGHSTYARLMADQVATSTRTAMPWERCSIGTRPSR